MTVLNPHIASLTGRRVFVTGHTGFKGTWLVHWLHSLGCEVTGYALAPTTAPSMFLLTEAEDWLVRHHIGDIRDAARLSEAIQTARPDLIIHLAAQPIVRRSYAEPGATWETNVMGTVNVMEAARNTASVRAIVAVTTDKVYENRGWDWGYREIDTLGGYDPYSASKAATELVLQSYRKSFFLDRDALVATARGGNVVGGGDWGEDRLVADAARSAAADRPLIVRNPASTRPWQHVLDCLSGYLTLAGALLERKAGSDTAYNFGPEAAANVQVGQLLDRLRQYWPGLEWQFDSTSTNAAPHEASVLYLDSAKAARELGWSGLWPLETTLQATATWYRQVMADPASAQSLTRHQIDEYTSRETK